MDTKAWKREIKKVNMERLINECGVYLTSTWLRWAFAECEIDCKFGFGRHIQGRCRNSQCYSKPNGKNSSSSSRSRAMTTNKKQYSGTFNSSQLPRIGSKLLRNSLRQLKNYCLKLLRKGYGEKLYRQFTRTTVTNWIELQSVTFFSFSYVVASHNYIQLQTPTTLTAR